MSLFDNNNNNDITYGIESTIWKSIEKSIENDSIETFKVLNKFIVSVLSLSIQNKSIDHFKKYIIFPASYYHITFLKAKENIKFQKLHKYCTERASMQLKEIISYHLRYNEKDVEDRNFEELKVNNIFYYNAFNGFNRLIYSMIRNGDISEFDYTINEYYLIDQFIHNSYYDLKNEIRFNFRNEPLEELELKKELYEHVKYFDEYKRHVIIGLRYWSIFLYSTENNNLEITNKYLERLKMFSNYQEMLKDVIYLRSYPQFEYFEWNSWDYKERPNGVTYSPPNPRNWLTFGFLIDLIRSENAYLSSEFLNSKELSQINYLSDTIEEDSKILLNKFEFWEPLLNVKTKEELESRILIIISSLKSLKRESINITDREIAEKELNIERITDFKNLIGKTWADNSNIGKLFFDEKNIELVDSDIKFIGQKTFFEKAKKMFIDGDNYQQIYNIGEIGGRTSRWIDDEFFDTIFSGNENFIKGNNILDSINKCLNNLESKETIPTTIIIPSEFSYKDKIFLNDTDFIRKINIDGLDEGNELNNYFLVTYKGINIYLSHSDFINNKVIVSDFRSAFKMKYKTNPDWYHNVLKIEVDLIDDDEAEKIYNLNPRKWVIRDNGIDLTKEEALILIKNAVNLEIGSYNEFEITNKDSFVVGLIQNKIEE
jgi:hypothetical protein